MRKGREKRLIFSSLGFRVDMWKKNGSNYLLFLLNIPSSTTVIFLETGS